MGNCFKTQSQDDISCILREPSVQESGEQALGPPPPYQVSFVLVLTKFSLTSFILVVHNVPSLGVLIMKRKTAIYFETRNR